MGGILYTLRSSTPSYTHENRRGDVIAKSDSSGSLTYQAQYEAFGKVIGETGSTLDRQKSNSKDTDPTGLIDEGFRYRRGCVFLSRDPAGFVDGPNLYCYVSQNPWTHFDPEGLTTEDKINGYAQGVTNGVIDVANAAIWVANTVSPAPAEANATIPYISHIDNSGQATDKNDFQAGVNGGEVFIAGTTAMIGGPEAGGGKVIVEGGEKLIGVGGESAAKATGAKVAEAPKPIESTPPGGQSAKETVTSADTSASAESSGRSGKQARLRELGDDPKVSSADRGWIKNEQRHIENGNRDTIRNPPGKDLAHERGREAAKGYSYKNSKLQDRDLHKTQHKYDDKGRANKERPETK